MKKKSGGKSNPVAKHMETFNRPQTHRDRKKDQKKGFMKHAKDWRYSSSFSTVLFSSAHSINDSTLSAQRISRARRSRL